MLILRPVIIQEPGSLVNLLDSKIPSLRPLTPRCQHRKQSLNALLQQGQEMPVNPPRPSTTLPTTTPRLKIPPMSFKNSPLTLPKWTPRPPPPRRHRPGGVALAAKALANLEVVQEAVLALCQACKDAAIPIAVKPSLSEPVNAKAILE